MNENILEKEATFHDAWASATALDAVEVDGAFEAITAMENRFALKIMGDLKGKKILDVGCGLGESAIYFAKWGADVTALDLSPKMIELCLANAARFGVVVEGVVAAAEKLNVPDQIYDIVFAANILHHVTEKEKFYQNIQQALKPGGLFVAWDPIKYNPVINVYRRMATKVRTEDETPLGFEEFEISRKYFPNLKHREFWLCTLALFLKYYFFNRKDPNRARYWKEILKENKKTIGWWFIPLQWMDNFLLRLPLVRRLAWNTVQWGNRL